MTKWMVLTAMVVVIALAGSSVANESANGIGYFALQLPDPGAFVLDGLIDDWGWFDPAYIVTPDQMACTLTGQVPEKSDWDCAIMVGWTPEPDNRLYAFIQVVDDTLNIDETAMDAGWRDDDMEIPLDVDHSNTFHGPPDGGGTRTDMQQITFHIPTPGGYPQCAYLRYNQIPEMQWPVNEGLIEGVTHVDPKAEHLQTDVTVGYEIRMMAWDYLSPDGANASTRHIFAAGQVLGMSVTIDDADGAGRTHQISTHPQEGGAHDSDFCSEFTLLAIGEYDVQTAVEPGSWGAVKALFR
jgi:hypothetical protein